jgi:outer membrane protein
MKNIFYGLVLVLAFTSCEKSKIGFVDSGILINEYQKKKDLETKFQIREQALRKKFDSIENAFQIEAQKFQAEANRMAQATAQQRYEQLALQRQSIDQQKQIEGQQFQQEFQVEVDTLIISIKKFVKEYGKKNGYTFILGTSDAAATVLYGTKENDLTRIILDDLNECCL